MASTSCIPDDRLCSLLLGELTDEAAAPLEDHLLECPQCLARTRSLKSADTLVAALQGARGGDLSADQSSSVQRLVQRLSDRSQLTTHSSLLDATVAPGSGKDLVVEQIVARLEAGAKPEELGRLGSFRVLKLLGHGGMGAVFLAEDMQLRRHVALKLLKPALLNDREAVERFMREARAAAAVRHDNIVTIFQVGEVNGVPFLAQELLEGETLDDRLRREEKLPINEALRIGREIAAGLAAAHDRRLLHRDIKPSNIWLETSHHSPTHSSRVKLLDFGLARIESDEIQLTQSGMIVGTPAFMSPEQAQGKPLDIRSDLFSLGCVLYRMVAGRLPFQGTDTLSMLRSLAVDEPRSARSLNPAVPVALSQLISRLLAKDPTLRPQAAADVVHALAGIENSLPAPIVGKKPAIDLLSRNPVRIALAATAAALICGAIIITITRPDGSKKEIKVDGDAKVELVIETSTPKSGVAVGGAADHGNGSSGSQVSSTDKQPPVATAKPIYEADFLTVEPSWLNKQFGSSDIRDGHLILRSNQATGLTQMWAVSSRSVPKVDQADIEVVGRAAGGLWGVTIVHPSGEGIALTVDSEQHVAAWRTKVSAQAKGGWVLDPITVRQSPMKPSRDAEFIVLRVAWRHHSLDVWLNGQPACETIQLDQALGSAIIGVAAKPIDSSFDCEFDSFRIWRTGEGPPRATAANNGSTLREPEPPVAPRPSDMVVKPVYETDFSAQDLLWSRIAVGKSKIRDGHLILQSHESTASRKWLLTTSSVPKMAQADIEVVGRATSGMWGLWIVNDRGVGIVLDVDMRGQVCVRRYEAWPDGKGFNLNPLLVGRGPTKPIRDGEFSVLRVAWRERSLDVWLNGEPAFETVKLDEAAGFASAVGSARIGVLARPEPDGSTFDCEFDLFRIWRAGEGPVPLADRPLDRPASDKPAGGDETRTATTAKPLYQVDFSNGGQDWTSASFKLQGGQLLLQPVNQANFTTQTLGTVPLLESADIEVVGRASTGYFGCTAFSQTAGIAFGLDSQGKLGVWQVNVLQDRPPGHRVGDHLPLKDLQTRKIRTWNSNDAANTLRVRINGSTAQVWVNGEPACDDIELTQPLGFFRGGLGGVADGEPFTCRFDSLRIWRAGDAPPLAANP